MTGIAVAPFGSRVETFDLGRGDVMEFNPIIYADGLISRLPPWARRRVKDFFVYSIDFLPLPAGVTRTRSIGIEADSHFMLTIANRVVTTVDDTTTFFGADGQGVPQTVLIKDSGSGRDLMDSPVHIDNLMGTAQRKTEWPYPKLIARAGTLSTSLTNLDLVNDRNVRISYLGFKVFQFLEQEEVQRI